MFDNQSTSVNKSQSKNIKKNNNLYLIIVISIFILIFSFLINFRFDKIKKIIKKIKSKFNEKSLNWKTLNKHFLTLVKKYEYLIKEEEKISEDSTIWVMWYQGIENAPSLIKSCIQSILMNRAKHPVIILDKNNLKKYIELPQYIMKKFNDGIISITHLSDIIRMAILSKYGGYWIDSTYLITTPLTYTNSSLFTLKLVHCFPIISKCLWAVNFLAVSKNNFLSTYSYNALLFYWKNYNKLIDYFLFDHIIHVAYENVQEFRDLIEKLPYIECDIFSLKKVLNNIYEKSPITCPFNKLERRINYVTYKNKEKTNFGYIIDKYNLNLDINNINNK